MRVVQFTAAKDAQGTWIYPEEGMSSFRNTRHIGVDIIGEYYGAATNATLNDYVGVWPIVDIVYKTLITLREFKTSFTPAEYRAINVATTTDDIVFQFWDIGQTTEPIDLEHPQTIEGMAHLVAVGLITQARHDTIMQGVVQ